MLARLGELYERSRRWRDAAEAYRGAVALNPRSARVRRRLAATWLEAGDASRARDVLGGAAGDASPRDAAGHHMLAETEIALANFEAAEAAARRLIELEPNGLRGPYVLSQVFERRHEYRRVVETLDPVLGQARAMRPNRMLAEMLDQLGRAYQWLEDPAGRRPRLRGRRLADALQPRVSGPARAGLRRFGAARGCRAAPRAGPRRQPPGI